LLALALAALLCGIGYRWTELAGGQGGLGGVTRSVVLGLDLESDRLYYWAVAAIGMAVTYLLWRFHRSPVGSVLVAIRENEERARFLGYPTNRYKLIGFVLSATVVAIAGTLSVFNHRFASAEPLAVAFSGELVAMVVIGGMRSFLGPALGALFFILFREFLSIWTAHWLFYFGVLFVGFIVFSPTGLVGVAGRITAPFRKRVIEAAAMAGRRLADEAKLPQIYRRDAPSGTPVLLARGLVKRFGGIHAVDGVDLAVEDRTLHALIGPNGACECCCSTSRLRAYLRRCPRNCSRPSTGCAPMSQSSLSTIIWIWRLRSPTARSCWSAAPSRGPVPRTHCGMTSH